MLLAWPSIQRTPTARSPTSTRRPWSSGHAPQRLAKSNLVKDEFLGLVSHELRTPVTTIFGNAHLLKGRATLLAAEETESMLTDIADESTRLLGIIENLLLLTRLGSGTPPDQEPQ